MCNDVKMDGVLPADETNTDVKKNLAQRRLEARRKLELREDEAMLRQQLGDDYDDLLEVN